jgi:hypothetical protein
MKWIHSYLCWENTKLTRSRPPHAIVENTTLYMYCGSTNWSHSWSTCPKPFQDIKPEPQVILLCLVTDDFTGKEWYRGILGFGGWVGASPKISKGFLFGREMIYASIVNMICLLCCLLVNTWHVGCTVKALQRDFTIIAVFFTLWYIPEMFSLH